jgi:arabinose-5-phosphate isomerase
MTTVVDGQGGLLGIFTDGDLRRLHLAGEAFADARIGDVVHRGPKTIRADDLAAKALAIMETFAITSLVVQDDAGRPSGVVHMHDILRAKIV